MPIAENSPGIARAAHEVPGAATTHSLGSGEATHCRQIRTPALLRKGRSLLFLLA
ncbi:hypothetical protein [Acrocarpospora sp. B8E8]|uniref:hypothetical protein n=1 Tax=Acrocarpospora sp. B8E8 TaxID=3153572 RepID=UPI00325F9E86